MILRVLSSKIRSDIEMLTSIIVPVLLQIAESQPLIGFREDFTSLSKEYSDSEVYLQKVEVSESVV